MGGAGGGGTVRLEEDDEDEEDDGVDLLGRFRWAAALFSSSSAYVFFQFAM